MRSGWTLLLAICVHGAFAQQQPPPNLATLTTLFPFTLGGPQGYSPLGGLVRGPDGNYYGSTIAGGALPCRCGSVFRISPSGEYKMVYEFKTTDGMAPRAGMVVGRDGNLWGTSWGPGIGAGRIFRLTLNGEYTLFPTPLPGYAPHGLILASDGNFYGTTARGGAGDGTFFRVSSTGQVTLLHSFVLRTDTITIPSQIIEGRDGNFYGSTTNSVFRLTPTGTLSIITGGGSGIAGLGSGIAGVTQGADGDFYGTASNGIYKVTAAGALSVVVRWADVGLTFDEGNPNNDGRSRLTLGSDGNLYGVNRSQTRTAAYRITSGGQFQILYRFPYFTPPITFINPEGNDPSRLVEGSDGWYGVAAVGGPVQSGGGTVFKLTVSGGGGGNPPPVVSNLTLGPIEFADPNNTNSLNSDKTVRALLLGEVAWDDNSYSAFAALSTAVDAVAADGATPLVMRVEVPAVDAENGAIVVFRLSEVNGDETTTANSGTLGCIRERSCATSGGVLMTGDLQKVSGGRYFAFARLTAPADFVRANEPDDARKDRPITVEAKLLRPGYVDRPRQGSIALVRPPVVLLHGLWSSERTWTWTNDAAGDLPIGLQRDPRFFVSTFDYERTHAQPFAENLGLLPNAGLNVPEAAVAKALTAFRSVRMAATRVDFVGHSMGGLLGRYYAGEFQSPWANVAKIQYYRADNYYAGDIHKLITLDTPHRGSAIANALVDDAGTAETNWGTLFRKLGCMTCGAVADLRVGSAMLRTLPAPDVPSHAIVGMGAIETFRNAGEAATKLEALAVISPEQVEALLALVYASIDGVSFLEQYFLGGAQHDAIVSAASQTGGIDANATTFFNAEDPVNNPLWAALHFTVTHDSRISRRVIELLHAPVGSSVFARFPTNN